MAAANAAPRYGSSPEASAIRPQRGSWETSTIGAYVCLMPTVAVSRAAIVSPAVATDGSKLLASPSGIGKIVR